jgi:Lon protease-like protein
MLNAGAASHPSIQHSAISIWFDSGLQSRRMLDPMDEADFSAVPLFPLPNVVLFPRAILPLHIFEERYKAMTADALRGPRRIAMALLRPGWEKNYHGRPAIEPIVCIGAILSHEKLPDGKYNFLLQGRTCARVVREYGDESYRIALLKPLEMIPALEIDLADERRRLEAVFETPQLRQTVIGRKFVELLAGAIPTAQIADLVAFHFLEDLRLKQSILVEVDTRRRVARIADAVESLYSPLQAACPIEYCKDPSIN